MTQTDTDFGSRDIVDGVDAALTAYFAERQAMAVPYAAQYRRLWECIQQATAGGKRLRPAFVVGVYRALAGASGDRMAAAFEVAASFELLHTAFLMHDDVIDRDIVRRGVPNVIGAFAAEAAAAGLDGERAARWGEAASIIAGDLVLHDAQRLVARLDLPTAVRTGLLDVFDRSVYVTAAGELADVCLALGLAEAALPDVVGMTEQKTATYSFEGPLTAGAILAGADRATVAGLAEYGRCLGIAFQLRDDILGVFGDGAVTGKSVIGDLREGKQTLLMAHARTTSAWHAIAPLIGTGEIADDAADAVRCALIDGGSREFVESVIADFSRRAVGVLDGIDLPRPLVAQLISTVERCERRSV